MPAWPISENEMSYATDMRWIKKCKSGWDCINDTPKSARPSIATFKTIVEQYIIWLSLIPD